MDETDVEEDEQAEWTEVDDEAIEGVLVDDLVGLVRQQLAAAVSDRPRRSPACHRFHHLLRGSGSTVLTATRCVYGTPGFRPQTEPPPLINRQEICRW